MDFIKQISILNLPCWVIVGLGTGLLGRLLGPDHLSIFTPAIAGALLGGVASRFFLGQAWKELSLVNLAACFLGAISIIILEAALQGKFKKASKVERKSDAY
ncbi:MAG TPA: hypothetical protein VMW25_00190 [Clostridia bacterium]|nr:hypothetical protein [Clostridia bacterium]